MRKIDYDDDPLANKSPRKSTSNSPRKSTSGPRGSVVMSPRKKKGLMQQELASKIKEFERKSLLPYTEERELLILPSIYAVQFEKSGIHEKVFPVALQREKELKLECLSEN